VSNAVPDLIQDLHVPDVEAPARWPGRCGL